MIPLNRRQIYSELNAILGKLEASNQEKIPIRIREFIKSNADPRYVRKFDTTTPILKQGFRKETLALFAFLNLKYICVDEKEKERLTAIYEKNSRKNSEIIEQKLSHLHRNKEGNQIQEENKAPLSITYEKESKIKNIWKKFLSFLYKNK